MGAEIFPFVLRSRVAMLGVWELPLELPGSVGKLTGGIQWFGEGGWFCCILPSFS